MQAALPSSDAMLVSCIVTSAIPQACIHTGWKFDFTGPFVVCRVSSSCPDHRLAHAACPCYEQDDESQYTDVKAGHGQTADSWSAVPPMRRRLNYLVPSPNADRSIPLSVQKYMHKSSGMLVDRRHTVLSV